MESQKLSKQSKTHDTPKSRYARKNRGTFLCFFFPQHLCWGSPFLPPLSVSRLIAGIDVFRPPPWAEKAPLLLLLLCCTFTQIIGHFRWILPIYFCVGFSAWKPIITTQRFFLTFYDFLIFSSFWCNFMEFLEPGGSYALGKICFLRFFMIFSFVRHFGAITWNFWNLAVAMHLEKCVF